MDDSRCGQRKIRYFPKGISRIGFCPDHAAAIAARPAGFVRDAPDTDPEAEIHPPIARSSRLRPITSASFTTATPPLRAIREKKIMSPTAFRGS